LCSKLQVATSNEWVYLRQETTYKAKTASTNWPDNNGYFINVKQFLKKTDRMVS